MHIKLLDLINNKKLCDINDTDKNLCVVPTLLLDDGCNGTNSKKYKYTIVKQDKDNECIDDGIYQKLLDGIETHPSKSKSESKAESKAESKSDKKTTRRAKKTIKEKISKISRKEKKEKKPKIKIH
jgi:hypothetical protein